MIPYTQKGFIGGLGKYMNSPFRKRKGRGPDIEAIQWAICLLEIHEGVKNNPNSQMWLNRLKAILHHYKLDQGATEPGAAQNCDVTTAGGKPLEVAPAAGPTPRTDGAEMPIHHGICHGHVEVDFARQLERENARLRAVVKAAHALCVDWARFPYMHKPTKESDALVAAVREIERGVL